MDRPPGRWPRALRTRRLFWRVREAFERGLRSEAGSAVVGGTETGATGDRHHRGARADSDPGLVSLDWSDWRDEVWRPRQTPAYTWVERNRVKSKPALTGGSGGSSHSDCGEIDATDALAVRWRPIRVCDFNLRESLDCSYSGTSLHVRSSLPMSRKFGQVLASSPMLGRSRTSYREAPCILHRPSLQPC